MLIFLPVSGPFVAAALSCAAVGIGIIVPPPLGWGLAAILLGLAF